MTTNSKQKTLISLKKAQTLLGKIISMVEEGDYCVDIMQQNLAALGLLKSAHQNLLEGHLNSCFKNAMASKNEKLKAKMSAEILQVTKLYNK